MYYFFIFLEILQPGSDSSSPLFFGSVRHDLLKNISTGGLKSYFVHPVEHIILPCIQVYWLLQSVSTDHLVHSLLLTLEDLETHQYVFFRQDPMKNTLHLFLRSTLLQKVCQFSNCFSVSWCGVYIPISRILLSSFKLRQMTIRAIFTFTRATVVASYHRNPRRLAALRH